MSVPREQPRTNAMGVASFIFGVLALATCVQTVMLAYAVTFVFLGLLVGFVGLILAWTTKRFERMWAWTGVGLSMLAIALGLVVIAITSAPMRKAVSSAGAGDVWEPTITRTLSAPPAAVGSRIDRYDSEFSVTEFQASVARRAAEDQERKRQGSEEGKHRDDENRERYAAGERERLRREAGAAQIPSESFGDRVRREVSEEEAQERKAQEVTDRLKKQRDAERAKQRKIEDRVIAEKRAAGRLRAAQSLEGINPDGAISLYRELVKDFPGTPQAIAAEKRIKAMGGK
jgi:hypothetical protein